MERISFRDVHGIAEELGVDVQTVRRWIQSGKLRAFKPGKEYRVREADLEEFLAAREVRPKVPAPSPLEPSLLNGLDEERRTVEAEAIADFESITREYRMSWRGALEALAAPWEERLASGTFDRSMVEQFFTDVAAVSQGVALALSTSAADTQLQRKYKPPPTAEDVEEMQRTDLVQAAADLLSVSEKVYAAAGERFAQAELEAVRQKRDEARLALERAA